MNGAAISPSNGTVSHPWLKSYPKATRWDATFSPRPLPSLLDDTARRFPRNPCTTFLGRTQTFTQIAAQVDAVAAGLQRIGVKKGMKIGLFLPNCPTFIVYYYAILKAGGIVVNFNPLYSLEELTFQARDSDTEMMVTLDLKLLFDKVEALLQAKVVREAIVCSFTGLLPGTKAALFKLFKAKEMARPLASPVTKQIMLEADLVAGHGKPIPVLIDPVRDTAVLQYTGGTTGTPKGAMLTHANLYINVQQVNSWAPELIDGAERVMGVLPFFHVFAMTVVMNYGIAKGAEIIIMPRFVLNDAMKLIDKTRPTVMPGVPTLFNAIMNHPKLKAFDLSSLKFCLSGGAGLPAEIKTRFEALTGCKLVEGYGLSETSPVLTCNPLDGGPSGSIGFPLPQTVISLRDLSDPTREVPPGERGEVCAAGPQVMSGYWKRPEDTAQQFVGSFLRTGDVAVMDENGFFFIVDRIKDLIICSGYNVYPRRIEEACYEHPAIEEVTVIGIKDTYRGEAPKAFVKLKAGAALTEAELMAFLEKKLSRIELPAQIEWRDSLPKTMIGKLSKKELKAEEAERRTGT